MAERRSDRPQLFASYSRHDIETVRRIVTAIEAAGVNVWVDFKDLQPGTNWQTSIQAALEQSDGLLAFVSPAYLESTFTAAELDAVASGGGLIFPLIVEAVPRDLMPEALIIRQWLDLRSPDADIDLAAQTIAEAARVAHRETPALATDVENAARVITESRLGVVDEDEAPPTSVFLVHGHDDEFIASVVDFLSARGIEAIVLKRVGGSSQSLFQKFFDFALKARFAVVLIGNDDVGAARRQYEADGVGDRALQFRARQNVILELGFFYGLLGWDKVFVLRRHPAVPFPNFELPSDLAGVVFDAYDESGAWRDELGEGFGCRLRLRLSGRDLAQPAAVVDRHAVDALDVELLRQVDRSSSGRCDSTTTRSCSRITCWKSTKPWSRPGRARSCARSR